MENTAGENFKNEIYLKIWEIEQQHSSKRWTITTFFFGISFAVLGFSFQADKAKVPIMVPHVAAIISYWFAYLLFVRLNDYTNFLRNYLSELESTNQVSLDLQQKTKDFMSTRKRLSATQLLGYFGIVYAIGIVVSWFFI